MSIESLLACDGSPGSHGAHTLVRLTGLLLLAALLLFAAAPASRARTPEEGPPNEPARVELDKAGGKLSLLYGNRVIFEGALRVRHRDGEGALADLGVAWVEGDGEAGGGPCIRFTETERTGDRDALEQRLSLRLLNASAGISLLLKGTCRTSTEGFPAETRTAAQARFPLIRNTVGLSRNLRNNAVYDRRHDWLLLGSGDGRTRIVPLADGSSDEDRNAFSFTVAGDQVDLVFRPRYYQKHKNLPFYEPWTYRIWPGSIAGWCSWWPYRTEISEAVVEEVADLFAEKLRDYGCEYIQIDDGFQSGRGGILEGWLTTNERFPGGLEKLAELIASRGLKPGIWVNVHMSNEAFVKAHPDWFIRDADGRPHRGPWIGYGMDGSNPEVLDAMVRPLYRALRKMNWRYVKIDTLRHLLYDAIYPCRGYFADRGMTGEEAFRRILETAREELGRDTYILACWGVLPESIGAADGCRLGTDGFGPTTLVQYNSWNNVVWRNDPDHVDITPEGEEFIRPVLVCMAGAMMLLTDRVEVYRDDAKIEGARRSAPIPFTLPGQLYDFDPVKTDHLIKGLRNAEGGGPPGPIDADQRGAFCPWWLMEIDLPFDAWSVLARLSWEALPEAPVPFEALGLPGDGAYLVYEFWSKRFLGSYEGGFTAPAQEPKEVRVYAIRERLDRPQLLATSRHITMGGVDLADVVWDEVRLVLRGESRVVKGDSYTLVLHVPYPFRLAESFVDGREREASREGGILRITALPSATGPLSWRVRFERDR